MAQLAIIKQKRPKIKVASLQDAAHIALREERLGIRLRPEPECVRYSSKDPTSVFFELDALLERPSSRVPEHKIDAITRQILGTVEAVHQGVEKAKSLENFELEDIPKEDVPIDELFSKLDEFSAVASPVAQGRKNFFETCAKDLQGLESKASRMNAILQKDIEASNIDSTSTPRTPKISVADFVRQNPGPALQAATSASAPDLFNDLDKLIPRSRKNAVNLLAKTGTLGVHDHMKKEMRKAVGRRKESQQWVDKVMNGSDQLKQSHTTWSQNLFEALRHEKKQH